MTQGNDMRDRRIDVLLEWRDFAASLNLPVPSVEDMMRIGAAGFFWPPDIDRSLALPWQETISFLIDRVQEDEPDPVAMIPPRLRMPTTAAVAAGGTGRRSVPPAGPAGGQHAAGAIQPDSDPVLAALIGWKRESQPGNPQLQALKDMHLRSIVTHRCRTEAEISRQLPPELTVFAPRLAEVISRAAAPASSPGVPAGSPTPTPPGPVLRSGSPGPTRQSSEPAESAAPSAAQQPGPSEPQASGPSWTTGPHRPDPGQPPAGPDPELANLRLADLSSPSPPGEPSSITVSPTPNGVELCWNEFRPASGTVIYRVVSADHYRPQNPQYSDEVARTSSPGCTDLLGFRTSVRHVQVWCHVGDDLEQAARAEPILHAQASIIAPVQEPEVAPYDGAVYGNWEVPSGVQTVRIQRIPAAEEASSGGRGYYILSNQSNLEGFADHDAQPGVPYVYLISVEASVDGMSQVSEPPMRFEVTIPGIVSAIQDLQVTQSETGVFDLIWTPPISGRVRIYCTPEPVTADQARAKTCQPLPQPPTDESHGRKSIRGVRLPPGLTLAYFTPVTSLHDEYVTGQPQSAISLARIEDVVVVERSLKQVLTFSWPEGAAQVDVYIAERPRNQEKVEDQERLREDIISGQPSETVYKELYEAVGGLPFRHPLSWRGCVIHVVPVQFVDLKPSAGPPTTVTYPGLLRLWYELHPDSDKVPTQQRGLTLWIYSKENNPTSPAFALVHNPDRLPLHSTDGERLEVLPLQGNPGLGGKQFRPTDLRRDPGSAGWWTSVTGRTGFVRLFPCLASDQNAIALFDPPVRSLRLGPAE
jgi:hypothetical protein